MPKLIILSIFKKINKSIGDDMELTLKQFKGAIKEDKQIYKKGG
jgi:hypothetical protein